MGNKIFKLVITLRFLTSEIKYSGSGLSAVYLYIDAAREISNSLLLDYQTSK